MRKFNFTGRRPIDRSGIRIRLEPHHDPDARFLVEQLDLDSQRIDPSASVYVEAYYSNLYHRESFGTVGEPESHGWVDLPGFPPSGQIKFRVKAVDESGNRGLIVADERRIRPLMPFSEEERVALLEFRYADGMGHRIWDLEFPGELHYPVFLINSRLQEYHLRQRLLSDPDFVCLVYPEVMRRVLEHYLLESGADEDDDADGGQTPRSGWLQFVGSLMGGVDVDSETPRDEIRDWIQNVVGSFAMKMDLLAKYQRALEEE